MRAPHEAIIVPTAGPVYAGRAGQTRTERVHLVDDDGSVHSVEVYRVVNVGLQPELKPRVLAGLLHRLDDGRELALPFVYHDPVARKFALVIPPALAHLEMKEWARLMTEVAEDTSEAVPSYVREGTTVLGLGALEVFLESGVEPDDGELSEVSSAGRVRASAATAMDRELRERQRQLIEREREATEQDKNLVRMATDLSAREESLVRREQQIATARADLDAREAELAERRTRPLTVSMPPPLRSGGWREVGSAETIDAESDAATVVASVPGVLVRESSASVSEDELREVAGHAAPPPLRRRSRPAPPPLAGHVSGAQPPPLPESPQSAARHSKPPPLRASQEPLTPPDGFFAMPALRLALRQERGEIWLFAMLDAPRAATFDEDAELLLQLAEADGYPVVVLTLIGASGRVARLALDALLPDTRAMVERLERVFRASLVVYVGAEQRMQRALLAPREANARVMLERLARPRPKPRIAGSEAIDRVLADPPKFRDEQMPFSAPRPEAATTASVLAAVQRLEAWTEPHKLDEALLSFSVPKHVIEASIRRLLRAAIGFGLWLPPRLCDLAIEHKLAESRVQLVTEQLAAFRQRIERGQNDLDTKATLRNWEKLFAEGDLLDLVLDRDLRPWVERAARASGFPPPDLPLSAAELRRDLGDPGRRLEAMRELCRRGHAVAIGPIFEVLDELSPEEVAGAVVALLSFGERVAEGLVAALGSPSQHVRHACALGLGKLKLERTLPALLHQLEAESTASWAEMARAVGDFGPPALPDVASALTHSDRRERFMVSLAHLANHGCADAVKSMESAQDPTIALAARQALTRCARMQGDDQALRSQQPLRDHSPETRFSQVFYGELARGLL